MDKDMELLMDIYIHSLIDKNTVGGQVPKLFDEQGHEHVQRHGHRIAGERGHTHVDGQEIVKGQLNTVIDGKVY